MGPFGDGVGRMTMGDRTPMHAHNASRKMDQRGASLSAWHLRDGNGG